MTLDPKAEQFLNFVAASGAGPLHEMSHEEVRAITKMDYEQTSGELTPVHSVADTQIPVEGGQIALRIITPFGDGPFPVVVFFHGGGWVFGDLDGYEGLMRSLAVEAKAIVVGVDYRLAPEYKFPTAVEDCYAALNWIAENIGSYNGDPRRIAVAGDSAGGTLSTVTAMLSRDRGGPPIAFQALIYPATDLSLSSKSVNELGDGYFLTKALMVWCRDHYLRNEEDIRHPLASPLYAENLKNLPDALIIAAEYDPLRDEGKAYADQLKEAGNKVDYICYEGMIHTFITRQELFDQSKDAIAKIGTSLRKAFTS